MQLQCRLDEPVGPRCRGRCFVLTTCNLALSQLPPGPGTGADCLTWVPRRSCTFGLYSCISVLFGGIGMGSTLLGAALQQCHVPGTVLV